MKWVMRACVFGLALVIGVGAAALVEIASYQLRTVSVDETVQQGEMRAVSDTGVHVTFMGSERGADDVPYLKFVIYNDTWQPLSYRAHNPSGLFPMLTLNGKEMAPLGRCGTGMQTFYLLPGSSVLVNVNQYEFTQKPGLNDEVTVGFYLGKPFEERYKVYRSQPFVLPQEFRDSIQRFD